MKFPKTFVSVLAAAGLLFLGASAANASPGGDVRWLVISSESTDVNFSVTADLCVQAVKEIEDQGYNYRDSSSIMDRITALQFSKKVRGGINDIAMLYCYGFSNDIDLFDNGPGGPG